MKRRRGLLFIAPIAILFIVSGVVMGLWNVLIPAIFHIGTITFWQAMGLLVLSKILFGGFNGKWARKHCRGNCHKARFQSRLENMSSEEREKFKEMWSKRAKGGMFCKKGNNA